MGTLFRAIIGIAIGYALYAPHSFAAHFDTPRLVAVKAELAATHPGADLRHIVENGLKQLSTAGAD
jgi:hypothetical protein